MIDMNNFWREFRKFRDRLLSKSVELAIDEGKEVVEEFWKGQDWFVRTFLKKTVMKLMYGLIKKL